jgi:hypothetical protein
VNKLFFLNKLRWYARLPIKWLIFGLTVLVVCFPYPSVLARHIRHWRDPNALVEPDAPVLQPLVDELRTEMADGLAPRDALKTVERFVYRRIPYEWDWNNWGTADYLPTLTEAIEKGKEDCDGRAVVAASLLRNFGFNAQIVTDFAHVWVKTEHGETMGPGKRRAVVGEKGGIKVDKGALSELPRALAYGIAPFPLVRELIILAVLWLLMLRRHGGVACSLSALAFLLGGLLFLRAGGRTYLEPVVWMQLMGIAGVLAGFVTLLLWARDNARTAERAVHRYTS